MSLTVLQPGEGTIAGQHLLTSTPDTVRWGRLPNAASTPCLTVASGDTVTIDTLSHEGITGDVLKVEGNRPGLPFSGRRFRDQPSGGHGQGRPLHDQKG